MYLLVENISKSFTSSNKEVQVLNNISLNIKKGQIITIFGHSGVGKTTLLNIIGGLIKPDNGFVTINNKIVDVSMNSHKISYLFQKNNLLPEFTVLENMILPLIIDGYSYQKSLPKVNKLLKMIDLLHLINKIVVMKFLISN